MRVDRYRPPSKNQLEDYSIGCILLESPFFLPEDRWIPVPSDWRPNIVSGRTYDLSYGHGLALWQQIQNANPSVSINVEPMERYGSPRVTIPRLGQGSFRILVTDVYNRKCAVTGEKTLPALDAAHIKLFSENGEHLIQNGVLLRRDLHALLDRGYVTISPEHRLEVSRRIREEFENGRDYYRMQGQQIRLPANSSYHPSVEFLNWHNEHIYLG